MGAILNFSEFWTHPSFDAVTFAKSKAGNFHCPLHFHNVYEFAMVEDGGMFFNNNKKQSLYTKGQLIAINPGETHSATLLDGKDCSYLNMRVAPEFMKDLHEREGLDYDPDMDINEKGLISPDTRRAFWEFHNISRNPDADYLSVAEYGWRFFSRLLNKAKLPSVASSQMMSPSSKSVIDFMRSNMNQTVSLDDLAAIANLSEFHFLRKFKSETGMTPHQYLIRLRLETVIDRLSKGDSCSEVAYEVGFSDQAHMTRLFKKHYRSTPKAFQKEFSAIGYSC